MKKIISIFLIFPLLLAVPCTVQAAGITAAVDQAKAESGSEITVSGTAAADTWISIEGTDEDGNILYFSAVLSDSGGAYSKTFRAPEMESGTLTISVGNGSLTASAAVEIYASSGSDGSRSHKHKVPAFQVKVTFDSAALAAIKEKTKGNYVVKAVQASASVLSDEAKTLIGSRPVYSLSLVSDGTTISDFGGGRATVSIPYTPVGGEDPNKIIIYDIDGSGKPVIVPSCVYDAESGAIIFTTAHFSIYAVGYRDVSFTDVSGWYTGYVDFLAAREIIGGMGGGIFSPDASITRAQFVTILANLSGDDLSGYTVSSFNDVATGKWYFKAAQWAYENGVAGGFGGKFDPNASITREQMAVMLYNYAGYEGLDVSGAEGMAIREFSDFESISDWASVPIQWAINKGIVSGNTDGSFTPKNGAIRAQAAKMVALLLQDMVI